MKVINKLTAPAIKKAIQFYINRLGMSKKLARRKVIRLLKAKPDRIRYLPQDSRAKKA